MFRRAFIEEQGNRRSIPEMDLLRTELERRGCEITLYTEKRMIRGQVPLSTDALVAGQMPSMEAAFRHLKIPEPTLNDFPECLRGFLHRRVWRSTLADVERMFFGSGAAPVFVKPAARRKRFTGLVVSSFEDLSQCNGASRRDPIWCSEPVTWLSEYRVYVANGQVLDINHYSGDDSKKISESVVLEAIQLLVNQGQAPAGFAIDFGLLSSGETALVEMNDGYSIGAYGISAAQYTDFTLARWEELLRSRPPEQT